MPALQWPNGARLALSLVVNVEEGAEATPADGDKYPEPVDELGISLRHSVRSHGNESNYEYGIHEGWPRLQRMLAQFDVRVTFTAAARALERSPAIAKAITTGGHEVCSHGYRWVHQFKMDEEEERAFIRRAVESIQDTTGQRPHGWLSRYLHTENTRRLLQQEGFLYHMDDYSADAPFWAPVAGSKEPMLVVPYALDSNDMKFWTAPALTATAWAQYAIDSFDVLYAEGTRQLRMMSLGLHLRIIGRPGRIGALERFLRHAKEHDGAWFATRREIADAYAAMTPERPVRKPLRPA